MKAERFLQELIEAEQDYLNAYDEGEKPDFHVQRLEDLRQALHEVKSVDLADVGGSLPSDEEMDLILISLRASDPDGTENAMRDIYPKCVKVFDKIRKYRGQ